MSYCIDQKVSRVSQNVRDENKMGTPRKECPQLPADKERPQVPGRSYTRPKCFAALKMPSSSTAVVT